MNYESEIVIQARKALVEQTQMTYELPERVDMVIMYRLNGRIDKFVKGWFDDCLKNGLADIKLYFHWNAERNGLSYDYHKSGFICLWKDGTASLFTHDYSREDGTETLIFRESIFTGDLSSVDVPDRTEEWKKNLMELADLADRINYEWFGDRFCNAFRILEHSVVPNYESAPAYVQALPDKMKDILFARQAAWVFWGMGGWNDDPCGAANEMGLGKEHRRLSDELWMHLHKSLQYVANECYRKNI